MLIYGAKLHCMGMPTKQNLPHCLHKQPEAALGKCLSSFLSGFISCLSQHMNFHHYLFSRASVFHLTLSVLAEDAGGSFS